MIDVLIGLCVGALVSLVGGGGASIYLGVLSTSLPTDIAVSTSLFVALPSLLAGTLSQMHIHNIRWDVGNRFIIAAIPSIIIGTIIGKVIPEFIYTLLVGALLLGIGCYTFIRNIRRKQSRDQVQQVSKPAIAYIFGVLAGLMVGIGGLSGGAMTVAGLTLLGIPAFTAAGTATYIMFAMSVIGFTSHAITTPIAWSTGFFLMIGAVIGSAIMPLLLAKIDTQKLNKPLGILMSCIVMFFGAKMMYSAW